jgi:hypothetical protein
MINVTVAVIGRLTNNDMKEHKPIKLSREYPKTEKNQQLLIKYLEKNHGISKRTIRKS